MPELFEPICIGSLHLRNRMMRSATAERMAHPQSGVPLPKLAELYRELAVGGIGLIVTGHTYVARGGKAHVEMAALDNDDVIPAWRDVIGPAQAKGARVMVQISHGGAQCEPAVTPHLLSPSGVATSELAPTPGVMADEDVETIVSAFGQAARRAQEAGFDGVQIHGAHGYLTTQFLTPATNRRSDRWGGDPDRRLAFFRAVATEVKGQVSADYPVWIKLGVAGKEEHGFGLADGSRAAALCSQAGIDAIEISHGRLGVIPWDNAPEPPYLPLAEAVRETVGPAYPLALVSGFRRLGIMQRVLDSGLVQLISLCRPLIVEPDLPRKFRDGLSDQASCARCTQCWPDTMGEGVACHNRSVQKRLAQAAVG